MPMRRDILIWLAIWNQIIRNIKTREICSVQEVNNTVHIEPTSQADAVTLTVVHLLFVRIAVVNVWAATLSLVVKLWQRENLLLIKE